MGQDCGSHEYGCATTDPTGRGSTLWVELIAPCASDIQHRTTARRSAIRTSAYASVRLPDVDGRNRYWSRDALIARRANGLLRGLHGVDSLRP